MRHGGRLSQASQRTLPITKRALRVLFQKPYLLNNPRKYKSEEGLERVLSRIVLALLLVSMLILVFVPANGYTTLLQQDAIALTLHQYTFYNWQTTAQQFASYTDSFQIHYDASSSMMLTIHSLDPSYIGLLYRDLRKISIGSPEWAQFEADKWDLKDEDGAFVTSTEYGGRMVDIGNPDYQHWVAQWILNETTRHGYDGVFCDDGFCAYPSEIWYDASSQPINPRTGTAWTVQQVSDAYVSVLNKIRAALGASKLIVCNGVYDGDKWQTHKNAYEYILDRTDINGLMGEGWWMQSGLLQWCSEADWRSSLDSLVEFEDYFVKGNSSKLFIPTCYVEIDGISLLPEGARETQVARYGFASTLLAIQSTRDYLLLTDNATLMADYYKTMFSKSIGYPLDNYSVISSIHVYQRSFSKALVLVNPTGSAYVLQLDGTFTNLDGANVSGSYLMPAHTGEVLYGSGNGSPHAHLRFQLPDLVLLANAYGSRPGDAKWNANADIDGNGVVDLTDLVILANHYA